MLENVVQCVVVDFGDLEVSCKNIVCHKEKVGL